MPNRCHPNLPATAAYWRERVKVGEVCDRAIINTTSGSGLHGNVGQTSYAAAKAGIAAMTLVNAAELDRYGVRANRIAPFARTRLTDSTPGMEDLLEGRAEAEPDKTSPLVAVLASSGCPWTGQVFSVYGGSVGIYQGWSIAEEISTGADWTPAEVATAMAVLPLRVPVNNQLTMIIEKIERSQVR